MSSEAMAGLPYVQNDFPREAVSIVTHRPWPVPSRPWVMRQSWHDLLFAHWPITRDLLAARVPAGFEIDSFDGQAWIGVVPFVMTNVAPRGIPATAWLSRFPELNVRTYVRVGGKPGVFFFSLDAANALAVTVARRTLCLPYHRASMDVERDGSDVRYRSRRDRAAPPAEFIAAYRPTGHAFHPQAGTLEHFLTERYCLYARNRSGRPYRLEIHHPPWSLQAAEAEITSNTMVTAAGLALLSITPLLHFAKRQDAVAWLPSRVP